MKTIRWINPEAKEPALAAAAPLAVPRGVQAGKPLRLGLLENTKDNARLLLQRIGEQVRQELGAEVLLRRKENPATPADAKILDELAEKTDCVLTAIAD